MDQMSFWKKLGLFNPMGSILFDPRGVIVNFEDGNIFYKSQEFDETMLNFKQFVGIVRSIIPIVEEEKRSFWNTFSTIIYLTMTIFTILIFLPWDQETVDKI